MKKKLSIGSKVIHAGLPEAQQGLPFNCNPVFASTFHLSGDPFAVPNQYGRMANPGWRALEAGIADLEGGEVVVFPSGMAAITAIFSALLAKGDTLVLPSDGYFATVEFAEAYLQKFGIQLKLVPTLEIPDLDFTNVNLVFIETPSNPMLDVIDVRDLSVKIHSAGALLAVDNTTLTVQGQQPLALGADISVCSDTKSFNGHSDVLYGHVAASDKNIINDIRQWRKLSGSIPGPMETWLVHRGLVTLDMRLERMVRNAQEIAVALEQHKAVKSVRYPGLSRDPSYEIACRQMKHFGFIISFELENKQIADLFLEKSRMIFKATSFGGVHTMAERRARWGGDNIAEGVIRLSVGCECVEDLLFDISKALDSVNE